MAKRIKTATDRSAVGGSGAAGAGDRVAVVTGGNRGIGFETSRQLAKRGFKVVLTARDPNKGEDAARTLRDEGGDVVFAQLDVTDDASVQRFARQVRDRYGRVDVLVNNAGVFKDREGGSASARASSALQGSVDAIRDTFNTNTLGAFRVTKALVPLMQERGDGRIINVSSGMGQLSEMNGGYPGYRLSKAALNALTRIFADELKNTDIRVNSICPGWVRTDMGGKEAPRTPAQGADTIVWLATEPKVPTGGFFRDRKPIPW